MHAAFGAAGSLEERQYIEEVLRSSLDARVADAELALGRAEAVGAGAWPNPSIGWQRESGGTGRDGGNATQDIFAMSLPLVLSGRLGLEREAALTGAEAALARRARASAELRYEALRRFYAAVATAERRTVLGDSLTNLRRLSDVITVREKAGDASGYDRLRIGLEAALVEDLLRGATIAERRARSAALALLGPDRTALPTLAGSVSAPRPNIDPKTVVAGLETRRADLRALGLEAAASEKARRAAERGWIPEPSVNAGAQILGAGRSGASTGYVVGVELPLPLFQRRQGEAARAAARRNLAEARRAAIAREARTRMAVAMTELDERRGRLEAQQAQVLARAEELRQVAATAYRGGAADLLVLVDAERASREARLATVELALAVIEAEGDLFLLAGAYDVESGSQER